MFQSTRTSTKSLPKKQPTFAELQAESSQKAQTASADVSTAKTSTKRKRSCADSDKSDGSVAKAPPAPEPKKQRKSATTSRTPEAAATSDMLVPTTQSQVSTAPSKASFLSLPAELRNEIYALALDEPGPIRIRTTLPYLLEPALLATNRQVRSEAMGIWYGETVFEIEGSSPAVKFLRAATDDKLLALRCLHITTLSDVAWTAKYIEDRIKQLLREFQPRGLDRQTLRFMMTTPTGLDWVNLARLKRIARGEEEETQETTFDSIEDLRAEVAEMVQLRVPK